MESNCKVREVLEIGSLARFSVGLLLQAKHIKHSNVPDLRLKIVVIEGSIFLKSYSKPFDLSRRRHSQIAIWIFNIKIMDSRYHLLLALFKKLRHLLGISLNLVYYLGSLKFIMN